MKTVFQLGLPRTRNFWMGQAAATPAGRSVDFNDLCGRLNAAMEIYSRVGEFVKNPNYRQVLGTQAATFDDLKGKADAIADSVIGVQGQICLGGSTRSITDVELDNSYYFAGIMNSMVGMLPAAPAAPVPTAPRAPGAAAPKPAAPVAAGPDPLVIGGVAAVAAIGLVALLA